MTTQALNSMTFVINAAYTVTFANSIYLMAVRDGAAPFSLANLAFSLSKTICGVICVVMTMRFFFGNNQYVEDVVNDPRRTPWVKFYQFAFVAAQSTWLLICSFLIPYQQTFVMSVAALFAMEVMWYFVTIVVDRSGVLSDDLVERRAFFVAEMTNFAFVMGVATLSLFMDPVRLPWLLSVFALFIGNTAYDFRKNMPRYMGGAAGAGEDSGGRNQTLRGPAVALLDRQASLEQERGVLANDKPAARVDESPRATLGEPQSRTLALAGQAGPGAGEGAEEVPSVEAPGPATPLDSDPDTTAPEVSQVPMVVNQVQLEIEEPAQGAPANAEVVHVEEPRQLPVAVGETEVARSTVVATPVPEDVGDASGASNIEPTLTKS